MNYPQQGWPGQPQQPQPGYPQGYPQQPPQQGYPQGYPQQQQQQQQQPYAPQPGYPAQQGGYPQQGGYGAGPSAWDQAYEMGDASGAMYAEGWFLATVQESAFGTTQAGDKEAWKVKFNLDAGPNAGAPITTTLAMSLKKNSGEDNTGGLSILFRKLRALGIPVGEKYGDGPGSQPFWRPQPQTGQPIPGEVVAQMMMGRQVEVEIVSDHEWNNSKVRGIRMPRGAAPPAGAPTQAAPGGAPMPPQAYQGQPQQQPAFGGYQPGPPAQGYPQQPPQPVGGQPGYPQQPGAPYPGQPGMGQFTQQGQAQQPGPPMQQGPAPMQGAPGPMPPTQQQPAPAMPGAGMSPNGQPMQQEQQQPGMAPPMPPWAS
jgi:hypothetical protein